MKVYELINPSDMISFEAPDDEVATLAVIVLGEGAYGAEGARGELVCAPVQFGGFPKNSGGLTSANLSDRLHARIDDIVAALESVFYCSPADREAVKAAGGDIAKLNDAKRGSLNNIGARAAALAKALRGKGEPSDRAVADANKPPATHGT